MSETLDLSSLSKEQKEDLKRQLKVEMDREKGERKTYKELVSETIERVFPTLEQTSRVLGQTKAQVYDNFAKVLELKKDIYGVDASQATHTFTSEDGTKRLTIGFRTTDDYDDTVEEGIEMVKEYLASMAKDSESERLVKIITQLLARDQKGNLKASKVLTLAKYAQESQDEKFIKGVEVLQAAYRPQKTKTFISAQKRNTEGAWINVPLGMTEC